MSDSLRLSELIAAVGDEHVEVHPVATTVRKVRKSKIGTTLTLEIVTRCLTPDNFVRGDLPVVGLTIFLPAPAVKAAVEAWTAKHQKKGKST